MQRYLISYEFTDGEDQEEGAEMLINWYESGGPQNRPENYEVHSWIFMVQNGIGHSVVSADSLETIWKQWHPWRRLMDISIQPCMDLDETVGLFKIFFLIFPNLSVILKNTSINFIALIKLGGNI